MTREMEAVVTPPPEVLERGRRERDFFNRYSAAYGSLGAVMILMLWLYIFGLAYLIGGEINAVIERNTQSIADREPETAS